MNGELLKRLRIDGPYVVLEHAFAQGKEERMHQLSIYIENDQKQLEEAHKRVAELPQRIADMQQELETLERLELRPFDEMGRLRQ